MKITNENKNINFYVGLTFTISIIMVSIKTRIAALTDIWLYTCSSAVFFNIKVSVCDTVRRVVQVTCERIKYAFLIAKSFEKKKKISSDGKSH